MDYEHRQGDQNQPDQCEYNSQHLTCEHAVIGLAVLVPWMDSARKTLENRDIGLSR
jgi:hypothetical protein